MGPNLRTDVLRGLLRDALTTATAAGISLAAFFGAALHGGAGIVVGGRIRISFSSGDISGAWTLPNLSGVTQDKVFGAISDLLDRIDIATTELIASGVATPTDAEIVSWLLSDPRSTGSNAALWAISGFTPNYMYMLK